MQTSNVTKPANPSIEPLTGSLADLYAIYVQIAKADHSVRRAALYGSQSPPPGHTPFRPLPLEHFEARFEAALQVVSGEDIFRRQLARLAQVYGVSGTPTSNRQAA